MKETGIKYFFTATILNWKHLMQTDERKKIITDSLETLVTQKKVTVYAFVIMPNHIHLLWTIHPEYKPADIQRDFLKWTARQLLNELRKDEPHKLSEYKVKTGDRQYQVWERNSLGIQVYSDEVMLQKLKYIHENPVAEKWKLSVLPEGYNFSSASFYFSGDDTKWKFLTHVRE